MLEGGRTGNGTRQRPQQRSVSEQRNGIQLERIRGRGRERGRLANGQQKGGRPGRKPGKKKPQGQVALTQGEGDTASYEDPHQQPSCAASRLKAGRLQKTPSRSRVLPLRVWACVLAETRPPTCSRSSSPVSTSHSLHVWSKLAVPKYRPLGWKPTLASRPACPWNVRRHSPLLQFHSFAVLYVRRGLRRFSSVCVGLVQFAKV